MVIVLNNLGIKFDKRGQVIGEYYGKCPLCSQYSNLTSQKDGVWCCGKCYKGNKWSNNKVIVHRHRRIINGKVVPVIQHNRNINKNLNAWESMSEEKVPSKFVKEAELYQDKWERKRKKNPQMYPLTGEKLTLAKQLWWEDVIKKQDIKQAELDLIESGDTMVDLKDKEIAKILKKISLSKEKSVKSSFGKYDELMKRLHDQNHTAYKKGDVAELNKLVKKSRDLYKEGY